MRIFWVEAENPYTISLAEKIISQGDQITHTTSHFIQHSREEITTFPGYKNATLMDARDFYRRENIRDKYEQYFFPLDIEILSFFEPIERDFYIISDRWNYTPVSYRDRKTYFRDLIRFWLGYLQSERIEGVYFPCTPHTTWELVLLHACKFLNIPAFYLAHTAINNRSFMRKWYGEMEPVPIDYLPGKTAEDILNDLPEDLRRDFESDSIVTNVIKAENDAFNKQANLNAQSTILAEKKITVSHNFKHIARHVAGTAFHLSQSLWRRKFFLPMAMDKYSNMLLWQIARLRHRIAVRGLKAFYEQHAQPLDLTEPYVYFPLHLQPELTTQPEARVFEDHLIAIETIVKALPEGWRVYVKENPRQYDVSINEVSAQPFRTVRDLKDILAVSDKVSFVPQSIKSAELIESSKALVVLTGTAGWEALTSGKPCISLAAPWYSPCSACLKVQTPAEMKEAFEKVQAITPGDVTRALAAYIHFYKDKLYIATLSDPTNVGFNTISTEDMLTHHAAAIRQTMMAKTNGYPV